MDIIETTDAAGAARDIVVAALRAAIAERGEATMFVSGGSSPKPLFDLLAVEPLDWAKVRIGLVDERINPKGSNLPLVKNHLMQHHGAKARLIPMIANESRKPNEALYREMRPADVVILGMGTDGHTASWFKGSVDLKKAMDEKARTTITGVNVEGCGECTGGYDERLTLTYPVVAEAWCVVLFIPGAEKRAAFIGRDETHPVDILTKGGNLTVVCDPAPA